MLKRIRSLLVLVEHLRMVRRSEKFKDKAKPIKIDQTTTRA